MRVRGISRFRDHKYETLDEPWLTPSSRPAFTQACALTGQCALDGISDITLAPAE